jgi:hypothetical protein
VTEDLIAQYADAALAEEMSAAPMSESVRRRLVEFSARQQKPRRRAA